MNTHVKYCFMIKCPMNVEQDCLLKNVMLDKNGICMEGTKLMKSSVTTEGLWKEDPTYEESPWEKGVIYE
jgi:hypothetical protein